MEKHLCPDEQEAVWQENIIDTIYDLPAQTNSALDVQSRWVLQADKNIRESDGQEANEIQPLIEVLGEKTLS